MRQPRRILNGRKQGSYKYLAIDIETGGIGHDKSLLTVYMTVLDENFNQDFKAGKNRELELLIKPESGVYQVTAEALNVNGIDLIKHDANAVIPADAKSIVYNFLNFHSNNGQEKLIPLGHGVQFDVKFITESPDKLVSKKTWDHFVSYRVLDTATIGQFLKDTGRAPTEISGSLSSWANHFGIDASNAHDAKADVEMSVAIYKKFKELVEDENDI